jgi:hypothetical protein
MLRGLVVFLTPSASGRPWGSAAVRSVTPPIVLLHSPSVGPATWLPCARLLHASGVDAVVPDLRHIALGGAPYWPRVAQTVADAMGQLDDPAPVALVAHSNAGLFVPSVAEASPRPVDVVVLVDAAMPRSPGPVPAAAPELLASLRRLADQYGVLPRWTEWWPDQDLIALLPDPRARAEIVGDQPRLPLDYYEQVIPVPAGWPPSRGAYLQFTPVYDEDAGRASAAGWVVERLAGEHLHQVIDPVAVTDAMRRLVHRAATI